MIGVATSNTNKTGPNWSSCGYYLGTSSGCLFGQDGTWKKEYFRAKAHRKGNQISVRLDLNEKTLSFGLNGEWFRPAWTSLPTNAPLYPSFDVDMKGAQFTILSQAE